MEVMEVDSIVQIFVRTPSTKVITIDFNHLENIYVKDLKKIIEQREGISSETQRLIFNGKTMQNDFTLTHYNIQHHSTIQLAMRLLG